MEKHMYKIRPFSRILPLAHATLLNLSLGETCLSFHKELFLDS